MSKPYVMTRDDLATFTSHLHDVAIKAMDALMTIDPARARSVARAYALPAQDDDQDGWVPPCEHRGDWYEIRLVFDVCLTNEEIQTVSGCLGYSLRQHWRGESLSEPDVTHDHTASKPLTILDYSYDSTKTASDDPDVDETFHSALTYMVTGTPVRRTNSRHGKAGTQLIKGLGYDRLKNIDVYVR